MGGVYAGLSAMDRANDRLARGMQYLGGALAGISQDMAQTRNNLQFKEAQTYIFGLEEADNKAIEQDILAGKILDENQLRERFDELHTKRADAIQKYISDNISSPIVADNVGVWEKQSSVKSFAALGGRWLSLDMQRSGDIARKGIDERVANLDKEGAYSYVDTMAKYWSPQLRAAYKKDIDRQIDLNLITKSQTDAEIKYSGDRFVNAIYEEEAAIIADKYANLSEMDRSKILLELKKRRQIGEVQIEKESERNKKNALSEIASLQAQEETSDEWSKAGIVRSASEQRNFVRQSKSIPEREKSVMIRNINNWEKQSIEKQEAKRKELELEAAKPYKDDLSTLIEEAIKSPDKKIGTATNLFSGVFSSKLPKRKSAIEESADFNELTFAISNTNFKRDDTSGETFAKFAKVINDEIGDPRMRESLFKKLLYKTGNENYKSAYGVANKQVNQFLTQLFPDAVKNEETDFGYAILLDKARERLGVLAGDSTDGYTMQDLLNFGKSDPGISALVETYEGRQTLLGMAINKKGRLYGTNRAFDAKDIDSAAEFGERINKFIQQNRSTILDEQDDSEMFNLNQTYQKAVQILKSKGNR